MMIQRRDVLTLSLTALASAVMPRAGFGQGRYPERPIKLMVAFSAGGVNDVVGRQWAERMRSLLGSVYVENQGGGTGTIATAEVARAPADGYTLLLGSTSTMVLNPMTMAKVPYDPARDFVPVAIIAISPTSIAVHASLPVKTLAELIAYAKANPGKLSYGSAGTGTMSNLSGELFKQLTGLNDLVHIPYKGFYRLHTIPNSSIRLGQPFERAENASIFFQSVPTASTPIAGTLPGHRG